MKDRSKFLTSLIIQFARQQASAKREKDIVVLMRIAKMDLNVEEKIVSRMIIKIAAINQMVIIHLLFKKLFKSIID